MLKRDSQTLKKRIIIVLVILYIILPEDLPIWASINTPLWTHFTCQFLHVNLFHLLINLYAIYILQFRWKELILAYGFSSISTLFSFNPVAGFSSVLYALIGIKIFSIHTNRKTWVLFALANLVTAFIPTIAFFVHLAAFSIGVIYAHLKKLSDEYGRACKRG